VLTPILLIAGAYLAGAIPFGLLIAKTVAGVDVRETGSGNIGATNVARSVGKTLGIITLVLDAAKGAAPVAIARYVLDQPLEIVCAAGLAAIVGHIFPVYLLFRGGKGVATSLGVFALVAPIPTAIAGGVFLVAFLASRVVSVGSLLASLTVIAAIVWLDGPGYVLDLAISVVALVLVRHKSNIERLLKRREHGV
jgi:glycerol-3-phosphate acyltransferase PlsY